MKHSVATVPLEEPNEIEDTLQRLLEDFGAGVVLRALSRVLRKAKKARRTEGELDAARSLGKAADTCDTQGQALAEDGL